MELGHSRRAGATHHHSQRPWGLASSDKGAQNATGSKRHRTDPRRRFRQPLEAVQTADRLLLEARPNATSERDGRVGWASLQYRQTVPVHFVVRAVANTIIHTMSQTHH